MSNTLGMAMLATYARMGVQIDRFDNTDAGIVLLFSVPKGSYHKDADGIEMSDSHLAKRIKETLEEMGMVFASCKYKVRNECWTKEKAEAAERMAYKDMGYKDWQMKGI